MNILNLLVIIPILTVAGIAFSPNKNWVRWVSATGMFIQLLVAIKIALNYFSLRAAGDISEMLMRSDTLWFKSLNIQYSLGVDGIAVAMILLTAIVVFAGIFVSWEVEKMQKEYFGTLILLAGGVYGFFISLDLFTMFLFYEVAVIPMYLLIGIWGSGNKEYAAMKLTLMLMGGSALLVVGILGLYFNSNADGGQLTFNILEISKVAIPVAAQKFLFPFLFVGFGVLGAMFPFHTWSPDGHASAPTAVSMLHAGVLMKLGGYGCFRVAMYLLPEGAHAWDEVFLVLTGAGVVYGAFGAIVQKDLKYINAYSSVSHCALVLFALLMMNHTAMDGAILQMISHGLMTALFFALIGMIYSRTHTRNIYEMGGLMKVIPFISVVYMIAGFASLGLPGLSGFAAEMTIFVGSFQHDDVFRRVLTILACASIVITAVYILRVVGILLLGPIRDHHHEELEGSKWFERVGAITLVIAVAGVGSAPLWLSNSILESLTPIVEKLAIHI